MGNQSLSTKPNHSILALLYFTRLAFLNNKKKVTFSGLIKSSQKDTCIRVKCMPLHPHVPRMGSGVSDPSICLVGIWFAVVGVTYPGEGQEGECGDPGEHEGGHQHDQRHQDVVAEVGQRRQPSTVRGGGEKGRGEPSTLQHHRCTKRPSVQSEFVDICRLRALYGMW